MFCLYVKLSANSSSVHSETTSQSNPVWESFRNTHMDQMVTPYTLNWYNVMHEVPPENCKIPEASVTPCGHQPEESELQEWAQGAHRLHAKCWHITGSIFYVSFPGRSQSLKPIIKDAVRIYCFEEYNFSPGANLLCFSCKVPQTSASCCWLSDSWKGAPTSGEKLAKLLKGFMFCFSNRFQSPPPPPQWELGRAGSRVRCISRARQRARPSLWWLLWLPLVTEESQPLSVKLTESCPRSPPVRWLQCSWFSQRFQNDLSQY